MRRFRRVLACGGGWFWPRRRDGRPARLIARLLPLLLVALLAPGCAEKWAKPGASEPEFRAMAAQCDAYAFEQWPPLLREQVMFPARWIPPFSHCGPHGRCVFYPGYFEPPHTMVVDDNLGRRNQDRRACYVANGWTLVDR